MIHSTVITYIYNNNITTIYIQFTIYTIYTIYNNIIHYALLYIIRLIKLTLVIHKTRQVEFCFYFFNIQIPGINTQASDIEIRPLRVLGENRVCTGVFVAVRWSWSVSAGKGRGRPHSRQLPESTKIKGRCCKYGGTCTTSTC